MLRIYNSAWDGGEAIPPLEREEVHHLVRVRRVRQGEEVEILNGRGAMGLCEVRGLYGKSVQLDLKDIRTTEPPSLAIHLLVALPKGKTFAALLHKAVELGVSEITPMLTEHTIRDESRVDNKRERWESILTEAVKQSGNPWIPRLNSLVPLTDALENHSETVRLCAALQPGARPLWRMLGDPLVPRGTIQVFVGPEGDFSPDEYALLRDSGCHFTSLGPLVLKVETAASLITGTLHLWSLGSHE